MFLCLKSPSAGVIGRAARGPQPRKKRSCRRIFYET
nr:MAG TPA: hypothetical protein [Caudoviricetes sp.]